MPGGGLPDRGPRLPRPRLDRHRHRPVRAAQGRRRGPAPSYVAFTRSAGIEVAGIEFIEAADGRVLTYDVNTNTNYNPDVEAVAPKSGPAEIARLLRRLLAER